MAKENLGIQARPDRRGGLDAGLRLVVAVGISAGIGALVSAFPSLQPYTLPLCLVTLAFITLVNLRGSASRAWRSWPRLTCSSSRSWR